MAAKTELEQVKAVIVQISKDVQGLKDSESQHNEILGTVTGRLDTASAEITRMNESITEMGGTVKKVKKKSIATTKEVTAIYKLVEEFRSTVIDDINNGSLAQRIEGVERRFDKLRHSVSDSLAAMEKAKEELAEERAAVEKMRKRVKKTKAEFEGRIQEVDELQENNARLKEEVEQLKGQLAESVARHDALAENFRQLAEMVKGTSDAINARISEAEQSTASVATRVDEVKALGADLAEFKAFRASVVNDIQGLRGTLDEKVAGELAALKETTGDLMALRGDVDALKDANAAVGDLLNGLADEMKTGIQRTRSKAKSQHKKVIAMINELKSKDEALSNGQSDIEETLKVQTASLKEMKRLMRAGQDEVENMVRAEAARAQKVEQEATVLYEEMRTQTKAGFEEVRSKHAALAATVSNNQKVALAGFEDVRNSGNVQQEEIKALLKDFRKETQRTLVEAEHGMDEKQAAMQSQMKEAQDQMKKQIGKLREEVVMIKGGDDVDFPKLVLELKTLHGRFTESMSKNEERMKRMRGKFNEVIDETQAALGKEVASLHEEIAASRQAAVEELSKLVKEEQTRAAASESDLEASIAAVKNEVASVRVELKDQINAGERSLIDFQQEVKSFVKQERAKDGELQRSIDEVKDSLAKVSDALAHHEEVAAENVRSLKNSIRTTRQKVEGAFQAAREEDTRQFIDVKNEFLAHKDALKKLHERMQVISSNAEKQDARLDTMQASHEKQLKELHSTVTEETKISVRSLADDVERVRQSIDQFKGDTEFDLPSLIESLKLLKRKMAASVDEADEKMKKLKARLESVIAEFTTAEQAQLAEFRKEIGQSEQMVKTLVEKTMQGYKDEVNDSLAGMARDIEKTKAGVVSFVGDGKIKLPALVETFTAFQSEAVDRMKAMRKELQAIHVEIQDGDAAVRKEAEDLAKDCQTLVENLNTKLGTTTDELKHMITQVGDKGKERTNALSQQLEVLKGGSKLTLPKVMAACTDLRSLIEANKQATDNSIDVVAQKIKAEVSSVQSDVQTLSVTVHDASQAIEGLRGSTRELQNGQTVHNNALIGQLKELRKQTQAAITQTNSNVADVAANASKNLEKVKQVVERKYSETTGMIDASTDKALAAAEHVQKDAEAKIDALASHVKDTVKKLKEAHDEIKQLAGSINDDLHQVMRKQQVLISDQDGRDAQIMQQVKIQLSKFQTKMTESYHAVVSDLQLSLESIKERAGERSNDAWGDTEKDIQDLKIAVSQIRGGSKLSIAAVVGKLDELREALENPAHHEPSDDAKSPRRASRRK